MSNPMACAATAEDSEDPHTGLAADIIDFIRDSGIVESVDLGVWFFRGNAEDQLAGYLSERVSNATFPGLRLTPDPEAP
jgi:hypothetical protein